MIDQAIEEAVSFVIIAGDLFDGDWGDYKTGLFFVEQMGLLSNADIPVYLVYGNHDAESQITRRLTLPPNVNVFPSRKPSTLRTSKKQPAAGSVEQCPSLGRLPFLQWHHTRRPASEL
tara:strand:- start:188 stop:541 length:354 start_codon:yes stop_codon:yes gene_type:complete